MNKDEMKNRISMALKDPILQQGFEIICKENAELNYQKQARSIAENAVVELSKENAELKEQNIKDCKNFNKTMKGIKEQWNNEHYQLTKTKELLNEFMRISKASDEDFEHDYSELIAEAEQFLNSEVEK